MTQKRQEETTKIIGKITCCKQSTDAHRITSLLFIYQHGSQMIDKKMSGNFFIFVRFFASFSVARFLAQLLPQNFYSEFTFIFVAVVSKQQNKFVITFRMVQSEFFLKCWSNE